MCYSWFLTDVAHLGPYFINGCHIIFTWDKSEVNVHCKSYCLIWMIYLGQVQIRMCYLKSSLASVLKIFLEWTPGGNERPLGKLMQEVRQICDRHSACF